jgi:hypothetical protein
MPKEHRMNRARPMAKISPPIEINARVEDKIWRYDFERHLLWPSTTHNQTWSLASMKPTTQPEAPKLGHLTRAS